MRSKRLLLGLECVASLIFVGLGHHYTSSLREVYPIDGFLFYGLALILFVHVWRAARSEADPAWVALRNNVRVAWGLLREAVRLMGTTLRGLISPTSTRPLVLTLVGLNAIAAVLVLLWPSSMWAWLILWVASLVILIVYILPRSVFARAAWTRAIPQEQVWVEPEEATGIAPNAIGLLAALALLVVGQLAVRTAAASSTATILSTIADSVNAALKINVVGDAAAVLGGGLMLMVGTIIFAVVTRRSALVDRPRFSVDRPASAGRPWSNRWLILAALGYLIWLGMLISIAGGATGWGGVLPWLLTLILIGACWWKIDQTYGVRHMITIDRRETIALGWVALVMLIVLTFRLGDMPNSIWGDEGAFFSTATDIAKGQFTTDFFGLGTYSYPLSGSIYQSIWISLFGATIWAWRLGSVVVTVLAIFPVYFLARATLGRRVAWVALALYATLPYTLAYARLGYNNSQSILPVAATLALTWLALRRDSRLFAFAAGCAGGLGFFTYSAAQFGVMAALGWLAWIWLTRGAPRRAVARQMAVYLLGVLLVAAPPVVYGMTRVPDLFAYKRTEAFFANAFYGRDFFTEDQLYALSGPIQVGDQQWFYAPDIYAILLARGLVRTALSFHVPSLITQHFLVGALADPVGMMYLLGLGWCLARARRPGYAIWPIWLLLGTVGLSGISTFPPQDAHMVPIIPALAVLGALGLVIGIDLLAKLIGLADRAKRVALVGLVVVLGFFGLHAYFVEMPERFPPDLANIMLWQLQQMPRGSDMILVQPANYPDGFQLWGLRELDRGVFFHLLKPEAAATADLREQCPGECQFFFVASDYDRVMPYLTQTFGNQATREYRDTMGNVQAYAFAPKQN